MPCATFEGKYSVVDLYPRKVAGCFCCCITIDCKHKFPHTFALRLNMFLLIIFVQNRQQMQEKFYTMTSQIKLLLDIPERIWSAMEASRYLQATQLYLLCCHLHSLLQLETTTSGHYSPVLLRFPILVRQVATTGHFRLVTDNKN